MTTDRGVPFVLRLDEIGRDDLVRAGGKGANLGELVRAGFRVPRGFVVTTAAYEAVVERGGPAVSKVDFDLAEGSAIRQAVWEAGMPDEVSSAVLAAYRALGGGAVAVRSSATAEDLADAAFAGQQDTFVNVTGEQAVLEAVRGCWTSLWTDRAIAYRQRHGVGHRDVRIAVVVQRMVPAEIAGVLFTSNPVTGNPRELVLDASPGLGESVVSGLVTPEHVVIDKRWRRVVSRHAGRQEVVIRPVQGGGTERVTGGPGRELSRRELSRRELRHLARTAVAVERHFGRPQDIEWALADGQLHVLQTRPVTAEAARQPTAFERVAVRMLPEMLPVRPYPLDMTVWTNQLTSAIGSLLALAGLKLPTADRVFIEEDGVVVRVELPRPRPTARTWATPLRLMRLAWRFDSAKWQDDPLVKRVEERARVLGERDVSALSWRELLAVLQDGPAILPLAMELRRRYLPRAALAFAALALSLKVLGRARLIWALLSGIDTQTTATNQALTDLAAYIREDDQLAGTFATVAASDLPAELARTSAGQVFLNQFERFQQQYGHRDAVTPLLMTQRTWRDAPEVVLGLLKGFAATSPPPPGPAPSEVAQRELLTHPLLRRGPLRTVVLRLLPQARWVQQLREDTRFVVALPLSPMRRAALEMGARLVKANVLDSPDDVFHLRLDELRDPPSPGRGAELRALVARRKAKRAELAHTPLVDLRLPEPSGGEVLLRGSPGSSGVAEGPVRVVRGVDEFGSLRAGEVLVAPYTNPAWTPLFRQAVAVVVDSGGMASHAAIVAREYGIPAVMGTGNGTTQLTDGARVRVDGDHGVVLAVSE